MLSWRLRGAPPGRIGAGEVMLTTDVPPATEFEPAVAAILRPLALEPLRLWRRPLDEGIEKPVPESRCCLPSGIMGISWPEREAFAELDEALEATEAFCVCRSRSSSRVRRFTCRFAVSIGRRYTRGLTGIRWTYYCFLLFLKLLVKLGVCHRARVTHRPRARSERGSIWRWLC